MLVMFYFLVRALATECVNYLFTYDLCIFLYVQYMLIKFTLQKNPEIVLKVTNMSEVLGYFSQ